MNWPALHAPPSALVRRAGTCANMSTPTHPTAALWNARAAGHDAERVVDALVSYSPLRGAATLTAVDIVDTIARYGRLQLVRSPWPDAEVSLDRAVLEEVLRNKKIAPMLGARTSMTTPSSSTPANAAGSSSCCSRSVGPQRISPVTSMVKRTPDQPAPGGLAAARLQRLAADSFWAGGSGDNWCVCAAMGPARRWSVRPQWQNRRRR